MAEGASEIGYALREPAEEDVTEEGEGEGEEDSELRFGRLQQAEAPHEVHEDQQRQNGGQREDGACGFAELHWTLTDSRSSKGKPDDRVPSLSLSVPGAGADSKEKRLVGSAAAKYAKCLRKIGTPEVICKPVSPRGKRPARSRTSSPFLASPSGGSLTWPSAKAIMAM